MAYTAGIIGIVPMLRKRSGFPVQNVYSAALGGYPQETGMIFEDILNIVIADTAGIIGIMQIPGKGSVFPVQFVQPADGSDPQCSAAVFVNGEDTIIAQAVRVVRVMTVVRKTFRVPIKAVQPPAFDSTGPDNPLVVFIHDSNGFVAQTMWIVGIVTIHLELIAVIPVQPIRGGNPDKAMAIMKELPGLIG